MDLGRTSISVKRWWRRAKARCWPTISFTNLARGSKRLAISGPDMPRLKDNALWLAILVPALFAARIDGPGDALVAHEWGTFTSVAGQDGGPVRWAPLSGPSDLS